MSPRPRLFLSLSPRDLYSRAIPTLTLSLSLFLSLPPSPRDLVVAAGEQATSRAIHTLADKKTRANDEGRKEKKKEGGEGEEWGD